MTFLVITGVPLVKPIMTSKFLGISFLEIGIALFLHSLGLMVLIA